MSNIRVILINCYGKSGSTLLDILIGNHPLIESLGELINLPTVYIRNDFIKLNEKISDNLFFNSFLSHIINKFGSDFIHNVHSDCLFLFNPHSTIYFSKKHVSYLRKSSLLVFYKEFFSFLALHTNKSIFVDSSKNPNLIFLYNELSISYKSINILRNPIEVYYSLKSGKKANPSLGVQSAQSPKTFLNVLSRWFFWYSWIVFVKYYNKVDSISIRYDSLLGNFESTYNTIFNYLNVNPVKLTTSLYVGNYIVAGNRLRLNPKINVCAHPRSKSSLYYLFNPLVSFFLLLLL